MDAITKKLCDEASISYNKMITIGTQRKAVFEQLQSVERDSEAYGKLRQAHCQLQAKWDAAFNKFLDAEAKRTEALKRANVV